MSTIAGTVIRFYTSAAFADANGTATDPTTVTFAYQVGSNPVLQTTYGSPAAWGSITKDGTGLYHVDVDTTGQAGVWTYVWAGTGTVQTRAEGQIMISPATVTIT
jgi:hypothetical protein